MTGFVVIDASLAVKWLIVEEYTKEANALAGQWSDRSTQMVALHLLPMEVANTLHQHVRRGHLTLEAAILRLNTLKNSGVQLRDASNLHARAMELASELRQGAVYDAHYLALAESLECELWTADQRFQRAANAAGRSVRWVGESVTPEVV